MSQSQTLCMIACIFVNGEPCSMGEEPLSDGCAAASLDLPENAAYPCPEFVSPVTGNQD